MKNNALTLAGAAGLWWGRARGNVSGLLAVAVLTLLAVVGAVGLRRARAARRWNAAVEASAERELARAR